MRIFQLICLLLLVLLISSCEQFYSNASDSHIDASKVEIVNNTGTVVFSLRGEKSRLAIERIISDKKKIMKKILPVFGMKLIIESENKKQVWLFAKPNYIRSTEKNAHQIYVINDNVDLLETMKELAR